MQTIDLVKKIVEALEDKKAEDITVLDIGEVSSIADYFICLLYTSPSPRD